jgi:carbonic anhydrase/acetyltransferase-like protein (isoleucine patch superfamily)
MALRSYQGKHPRIDAGAYVDDMALVVGDVEIGTDSSIWPMCVVRGDVNTIRIGKGTNIQDGSVLHVTHRSERNSGGHALVVGDRVTVGHKVILHGCSIGNECLIGMGSIVMDGVVVEDRVLLGAGSLVPPGKTLQSGYLYLGNPVRRVRPLNDRELGDFDYSARHYMRLKDEYLGQV